MCIRDRFTEPLQRDAEAWLLPTRFPARVHVDSAQDLVVLRGTASRIVAPPFDLFDIVNDCNLRMSGARVAVVGDHIEVEVTTHAPTVDDVRLRDAYRRLRGATEWVATVLAGHGGETQVRPDDAEPASGKREASRSAVAGTDEDGTDDGHRLALFASREVPTAEQAPEGVAAGSDDTVGYL